MLIDVTVPQGTLAAAGFLQFIPVFSGPSSSWYELTKANLKDGKNEIKLSMDGSKVGTPSKFYFVLNSDKPLPGEIYVDNVRMHKPGKIGHLNVHVKDDKGLPVQGAVVAAGKEAIRTDTQGLALLSAPGDRYPAEVLGLEHLEKMV